MTKPTPVDDLQAALAFIDAQHSAAIETDPDPGYVDLAASVRVIDNFTILLENLGLESKALRRLHLALYALMVGERPHAMLSPRKGPGTPVRMTAEMLKGGLAAVMEMGTDTRKENARWVLDHIPADVEHLLRMRRDQPVTSGTIGKWHERFSGAHGDDGAGRRQYLIVRELAKNSSRSALMKAVLKGIGAWLPKEKSSQSL